ncbi:opsin-3 [Plakobranchus ocellatus]|uniref:Opsin-3 n=1 Tax=Plakobranchus ocellatus TaxID=259542 RepID=A0AAV3ZXX6_9GAST|nr:opsin-3 [Plakobranchus ocellatus]
MKAAKELKEKKGYEAAVDYSVSVDGTWQRKGHASHHGVVTIMSVDTGKCLDVETLSNDWNCQHCEERQCREPEAYDKWKAVNNYKLNHQGSAGAMEGEGCLKNLRRSEMRLNLRFTEYLGEMVIHPLSIKLNMP